MNNQIHEEAADWLVELRTGEVDAATRTRFDAWIRKSPEHLRAYLEITEIWQDAAFVGSEHELSHAQLVANGRSDENIIPLQRSTADETRRGSTAQTHERSIGKPRATARSWLAFAVSVASAALVAIVYLHAERGIYRTDIGEQRSVRLDDGSMIEINARSRVRVRYSDQQRSVELLEGQALFRVAKDKARPFIVSSGRTRVRAVGTQFDVYRRAAGTTITVLEGRVLVLSGLRSVQPSEGPSPRGSQGVTRESTPAETILYSAQSDLRHSHDVLLASGEQLTISPQLPLRAQKADVESVTAWTQHRLVFKSSPLTSVAEEFNRYNPRQLVIADPTLADFLISGIYSTTDPALLVRFLREQPGLTIDDTGEDIVIARAR